MRASGTVDGLPFDVSVLDDLDEYENLTMHSGHPIENWYGYNPTFAVRWPASPGPQGECGIVIDLDLALLTYSAWFFDCDLQKVRDLTVLSVDLP